jgi:ABC-type uncharacterized transport system ATPase subunit
VSATATLLGPPDLELRAVTKRFGSFTACDNVSLKLPAGTFHALLGENGAGKSTLVKCIMGFHQAEGGQILIDGQPREVASPFDAHSLGIGMVYQNFTLVPSMTVAENLVLSRPHLPGIIDWALELGQLAAFMQTAPFKVDLSVPAAQLAAGEKQKVEILKQIYLKSRLLILDEPTSVLTPNEADEVLGLLKEMVKAKRLSVLLITHKFREVQSFADEITVLRRGKFAGSGRVADLSADQMSTMMLGEQRSFQAVEKTDQGGADAPVLELRSLRADKDNGLEAVTGVSLTVRPGEIVGIAGVSGNGQRELVEVLAGQRPLTGGEMRVRGEIYGATRAEIAKHHIYVLPEEPLHNACVPRMSVAGNMALRHFDRRPMALGGWLVNQAAILRSAQDLIRRYSVKTRSAETPIGDLSGGNIQRAVLARELGPGHARVLIAANPCFGLDFAAVDAIQAQIVEARNRGVGVLLVSEDLDELLNLSDRILVMAGGAFVHETTPQEADIQLIGKYMAGH